MAGDAYFPLLTSSVKDSDLLHSGLSTFVTVKAVISPALAQEISFLNLTHFPGKPGFRFPVPAREGNPSSPLTERVYGFGIW